MSWKEQLRPAQFRNVPFLFQSADGQLGRRVQVHEYPGRDLPFAEDLGRRARHWTLEVYVLGADYMARRDALVAALEQPGPGTLVHPYLGSLSAVVTEARGPQESTREGGMARFSITFVEAGDNSYPAGRADSAGIIEQRGLAARESIGDAFARVYDVSGQPEFVAAAALDYAAQVLAVLGDLSAAVPSIPGRALEWFGDLGRISGTVASLIRQPAGLATSLLGLITGLSGLTSAPLRALDAYRNLWPFGDAAAPVPTTTPARKRQAANQEAVSALVRQAAVVAAAETIPQISFDSIDEARQVRDEVAEALDAEMLTAPDDVYQAMAALRVAVIRDIAARPDLARLVRITPAATVPAVVLAHQLYGDATREADLIRRNRLRHPGFVAGGQPLEVLADA